MHECIANSSMNLLERRVPANCDIILKLVFYIWDFGLINYNWCMWNQYKSSAIAEMAAPGDTSRIVENGVGKYSGLVISNLFISNI